VLTSQELVGERRDLGPRVLLRVVVGASQHLSCAGFAPHHQEQRSRLLRNTTDRGRQSDDARRSQRPYRQRLKDIDASRVRWCLETDLEVWQNGSGSSLGSVHAGFFNALSGIWSLSIDDVWLPSDGLLGRVLLRRGSPMPPFRTEGAAIGARSGHRRRRAWLSWALPLPHLA
jgi:hypothetical protein